MSDEKLNKRSERIKSESKENSSDENVDENEKPAKLDGSSEQKPTNTTTTFKNVNEISTSKAEIGDPASEKPSHAHKEITFQNVNPSRRSSIVSETWKKIRNKRKPTEQSMHQKSFSPHLEGGKAFVYMVLPPDGGYGWFIVLVSFLNQVIIDGIIFSIGIMLPFIAKDFGVSQSQIIFVSAIQVSFYYLSGPISGAIINKYGFRWVAISGSLGAMFSLLVASFSVNLPMLIVFYSFCGGPAFSMIWVSSQLIVGYYFEKYRPIAAGLSCSGAGVGFFTFSNINSYLLPKIGWQNTIRLHSGLIGVALLLCGAYKEVPPTKIGVLREERGHEDVETSYDEMILSSFVYPELMAKISHDYLSDGLQLELMPPSKKEGNEKRKRICCRCCRSKKSKESEESGKERRLIIQKDLFDKPDLFYTGPVNYSDAGSDHHSAEATLSGLGVQLVNDQKTVAAVKYSVSVNTFRRTAPEPPEEEKRWRLWCTEKIPKKIKSACALLFNFQLFRSFEFRVLFFSAFCYSLGLNIPFLFSKSRLELPLRLGSLVPMIIGASNFVSRIVSGFIAFTLQAYVVYLCGGAITFGGLSIFVSAFFGADIFWFQVMFAIFFGMAPGFFSSLRAIIYVKYMGLSNLTNSFGLIAMGMGTGIFAGTVLAGVLNDTTGTYMTSFIMSGVCLLVSGTLMLLLPTMVERIHKNRERNKQQK